MALTAPDFAAAAHDYARRGWRVIPLHRVGPDGRTCSCNQGANCGRNAGKHPKNNKWQASPRLSGPEIQETWGVDKAPNIGVATGVDSGFWVLDIDPDAGGMESMAQLVAEHGAMPETFVAQTGSGGYHYLFALPEFEVRNDQSGRVGKGIDVRGQGGQIVIAPSRSGKGDYTVVVDAPIAPAPAWLLEKVRKDEVVVPTVTARELPKPEDLDEATWSRLSAYAQRAIDSELARVKKLKESGWNGEPWNHTTFEVSCALIEFANSPWCAYGLGQAQADIMQHTPRDNDGFDDYTISKTFNSALQKVGDKARPMPEDRRQPNAGLDPMFTGPDVQGNPTGGDGAEPDPVARLVGATRFFGGEKGATPLYSEMADGVMELGPIGWGQDNDFWSYADGVWSPDHYVVQHRLVDLLEDAYRRAHTTNTQDVVQRRAQRITGDPLERLMNFRDTMLDWRTGELVDHDPVYGSTIQLGTIWDPEAHCPNFDGFLADVMHDDYVALAWEMIGYLMLSGNPQHVAFLLYGSGGNGKSTLLDIVSTLLGRQNLASESLDDLNNNRFRTASLFGKIANVAGDIDATYQENTATFKRLTGEDEITGEHKNMAPFKFTNWAVPLFSANEFPGSVDITDGYLRRWLILHFHKRIPESKKIDRKVLMELFEAELPGIARKGVEALRVLMERGHFAPLGEAAKGQEEFAEAIDQVRQWISSGDPSGGPAVQTSLDDLYRAYCLWADRSGARRLGEGKFSKRLEMIGYPAERVGGRVYHTGLSVNLNNHNTPATFF